MTSVVNTTAARVSFSTETTLSADSSNDYDCRKCLFVTPQLKDWVPMKDGKLATNVVTFTINSHDQGWTSDYVAQGSGDYAGSKTYFEAQIVHSFDDSELVSSDVLKVLREQLDLPSDQRTFALTLVQRVPNSDAWFIQANDRADSDYKVHTVTWPTSNPTAQVSDTTGQGGDFGFVQALQPTDRIAVFGRAYTNLWKNYIKSVDVELSCAEEWDM